MVGRRRRLPAVRPDYGWQFRKLRRRGFWTFTHDGIPMHITGDVQMDERTLDALRVLSSELVRQALAATPEETP